MAPLRIKVQGSSSIFCPAERAIVKVTVQAEGGSRERVSANVADTAAQLRSLFNDLAGKDSLGRPLPSAAVTYWSNSTLSTGYRPGYKDGGEPDPVYSANMSFEAKFQDFAQLGSATTILSTMEYVIIDKIDWRLTDVTKAKFQSQCRQSAVRDAITKARDYAAALDKPTPPVVEITDELKHYGSFGGTAHRMMAASSAKNFNFEPEDVSIESSVTVSFEEE